MPKRKIRILVPSLPKKKEKRKEKGKRKGKRRTQSHKHEVQTDQSRALAWIRAQTATEPWRLCTHIKEGWREVGWNTFRMWDGRFSIKRSTVRLWIRPHAWPCIEDVQRTGNWDEEHSKLKLKKKIWMNEVRGKQFRQSYPSWCPPRS